MVWRRDFRCATHHNRETMAHGRRGSELFIHYSWSHTTILPSYHRSHKLHLRVLCAARSAFRGTADRSHKTGVGDLWLFEWLRHFRRHIIPENAVLWFHTHQSKQASKGDLITEMFSKITTSSCHQRVCQGPASFCKTAFKDEKCCEMQLQYLVLEILQYLSGTLSWFCMLC